MNEEQKKIEESLKLKSYDKNRRYLFLKEKFEIREVRSCITCPAGGKKRVQSFGPAGGHVRCGILGVVHSTRNICSLIDKAQKIMDESREEVEV